MNAITHLFLRINLWFLNMDAAISRWHYNQTGSRRWRDQFTHDRSQALAVAQRLDYMEIQ